MAHAEQRQYLADLRNHHPEWFTGRAILEIGSLDINGTVRDFFTACDYVGVDLEPGPGVDLVASGHELDLALGSFDVAVSAECFEHNPYWRETFKVMCDAARYAVIMTCATTGRAEHGTSRTDPNSSPFTVDRWDYYQNLTAADFEQAFDLECIFEWHEFQTNTGSHDLYFAGIKRSPR